MRVENQPYIHYRKGSLVFYRLRDEIGEENLNRALANFIRDKAFQQPPYTTTLELLDYIRAQTPPEKQRAASTSCSRRSCSTTTASSRRPRRKRADGKYDVTHRVRGAKRRGRRHGKETPLAVDDWMDVGVFARAPRRGRADGEARCT